MRNPALPLAVRIDAAAPVGNVLVPLARLLVRLAREATRPTPPRSAKGGAA
jgi:hypothetical protein